MSQTPEAQSNSPEQYVQHIIELAKNQVRDTPEYRELRGRNESHPDAFRTIAEQVANNPDTHLSDADRSLLHVVGNLGVFAQAQQELTTIYDRAGRRPLNEDERWVSRNLKQEFIIPFNHHLKEFVNTHPNDEIRTVSSALTNAYGTIFSRYECLSKDVLIYGDHPTAQESFLQIQSTLDGMRHEVAAESMIEAAGYSSDHDVTAQEDASGNDLFIYLETGWEGFDVKASHDSALHHRTKYRFSRAVWSGLDWGDFKGLKGTGHGTLSIPFDTAQAKSEGFIGNIYEMVARNKAQRSLVAQQAGSKLIRR